MVVLSRKRKHITEEQHRVQQLLSSVLRFDLTTFKLGKTSFTRTDLAGLKDCSSLLIYEMGMECVATGLDVTVEVWHWPKERKSYLKQHCLKCHSSSILASERMKSEIASITTVKYQRNDSQESFACSHQPQAASKGNRSELG